MTTALGDCELGRTKRHADSIRMMTAQEEQGLFQYYSKR